MKRLKNILIIFICFLMFSGFVNRTTSLEHLPTYDVNEDEYIIEDIKVGASADDSSYDSRNYVNTFNNQANENQGALSICWAFSANNIIEAYANKVLKKTYNFSENQMDYVARFLGDTKNFGEANNTFNIVKYLFYSVTPMDETTFDPSGYFTTFKSKSLSSYMNFSNNPLDIDEVKIFNQFPTKDVLANTNYTPTQVETYMRNYNKQIKEYIVNYGAVMSIIHSDFLTKTSGNNYGWCYNNGSKPESEYKNSAHAITIIGWDDNYVWTGSNPAPYKGAWLAANSWGDNTTFFYISYYDLSVVRGIIGISQAKLNVNNYNNVYFVGESTSFASQYKDNRVKNYERGTSSSSLNSFTYNIGNTTEKLYAAKLLYMGFNNSTVPTTLYIKIEVKSGDKSTYYTKSIVPGINTYNLTNIDLTKNVTVNVSVYNNNSVNLSNMYYAVELFTKNTDTSKNIYLNSNNSFSSSTGSKYTVKGVFKNIDATEKANYTVKVYDDKSNDITSKYTVNKSDIAFNVANISLTQKSSVSTSYITVKASVGTVTGTTSISSSNFVVDGCVVDDNNKIIKNVSPKLTVGSLKSQFNGVTVNITDSIGRTLSDSSKLSTGYKAIVNMAGGNQTYTISMLGDSNSDGEVDARDIVTIAKYITNKNRNLATYEIASLDVTGDGEIDVRDLVTIAKYIVKKVEL